MTNDLSIYTSQTITIANIIYWDATTENNWSMAGHVVELNIFKPFLKNYFIKKLCEKIYVQSVHSLINVINNWICKK